MNNQGKKKNRPSSASRPSSSSSSSSSSRLIKILNDDTNNNENENENENNNNNDDDGIVDDDDDEENFRDPPIGHIRLRQSKFACIPSTVYIEYPQYLGLRRQDIEDGELVELGNRKLGYTSLWERICIRNAFKRAGFKKSVKSWTVMWSKHQNDTQMSGLNCLQKINHFPSSWCVGRKDRLARTMESMHRIHPNEFDFHPESYILPQQRDALHRKIFLEIEMAKNKFSIKKMNDHRLDRASMWIMKPCASSCGRGIKVITGQKALLLPKNKNVLLQKYLHEPYLIDGKKFDLRIYVLVTGVDPLRVYVHNEGLTRISTSEYSMKNIKNRFAHLTNYSINKKSDKFKAATYIDNNSNDNNNDDDDSNDSIIDEMNECTLNDKECNDTNCRNNVSNIHLEREGFKWSLAAFKRWLSEKESPEIMKKTFDKIYDLCCKTMIAAESEITPKLYNSANYRSNCFELFGCDVILDRDLNPHLLEVNVSPSLVGSSPLDRKIKGTLIADILHTVGTYPHDPKLLAKYDNPSQSTVQSKGNVNLNPFAFSSLSKMMESQDSWRKNPNPSSINFLALGNNESAWLLLLMAEDEFARATTTKFNRVHPTTEKAEHYVAMYKSSRFADHLLAKWVMESGSIGPLRKFVPARFWRKEPLKLSCPWDAQLLKSSKKLTAKAMASMPSLKAATPTSSPNNSCNFIQDDNTEGENDNVEIIVDRNKVNDVYVSKNPIEDSSIKVLPLFARQTSDVLRDYREHQPSNNNNNHSNNNMITISLRNRIGANRPRSSGIYINSNNGQHPSAINFIGKNNNNNNNNNNNIEDDHRYRFDELRSHSLPPLYRNDGRGANTTKRKVSKIIL